MKTMNTQIRGKEMHSIKRVILAAMVFSVASICSAANISTSKIFQNGTDVQVAPVQLNVGAGQNNIPYLYSEQTFNDNNSIAHAGALNYTGLPAQRVYAYNLTADGDVFEVTNTTSSDSTVQFEVGDIVNDKIVKKSYKYYDSVTLDGSLVLVKSDSAQKQKGLLASFDVLITQEYAAPTKKDFDRTKTKKLAKGSIALYATKNGKVKIKTKGKIKKSSITAVANEMWTEDHDEDGFVKKGDSKKIKSRAIKDVMLSGDVFRVDLSELVIPYKVKGKAGVENTISVVLTSTAGTTADDGGAEVSFIQNFEVPAIEEIHATGEFHSPVPEPTTLVLLLGGSVAAVCGKRRRIK